MLPICVSPLEWSSRQSVEKHPGRAFLNRLHHFLCGPEPLYEYLETAPDLGADPFFPCLLPAREQVQGDDPVEKPPKGVAADPDVQIRREFPAVHTHLQDLLDDDDGLVGGFDDVVVDAGGEVDGVVLDHE